ncbi:uncharacterized protein LOC133392131 [Anopheles gambiae]|uniref:uncharacterized protein LOC133392131 n=1 Tax=Anopheles gambiae TaxID=7165 RepID=UPI002AC98328|nr:uncharacterized protein LOC133392131 [Anopheles gambiae]XP_061506874.1 uncharacterized protein LOC133392131 [Anopheles gambiae]XP_061506875.1 uncharacterized protein LOC133392131 [Anopheles gambiae]XP_061506876.1 uncharacterized protein LOC133392131 [Anopheles gambiae]
MTTKRNLTPFFDNDNGSCRLCSRIDDPNMVQCDECDRWFHMACAKLNRLPKADEPFLCIKCTKDYAKIKAPASTGSDQNTAIAALIEALKGSSLDTNTYLKRLTFDQLPDFDGKAKEWLEFKRANEETTKQAKYTNVENMTRLQHALKGEAYKCVHRLFLEPDNVPEIITKLEEQFGRAELVYDELLKDVQNIRVENQHKIPDLSDAIQDMITNIKAINMPMYLQDHRLVNELACKLPTDRHLKWIEYKSTNIKPGVLPSLEDFGKWLLPQAKVLKELPKRPERPKHSMNVHQSSAHNTKRPFNHNHFGNAQNNSPATNTYARNAIDYTAQNCTAARERGPHPCEETHHRLHFTADAEENCHQEQKILYQIVPVVLRNEDKTLKTFALLDSGSSFTLIEEETANQLQLEGPTEPITMTWTQNLSIREKESRRVSCLVKGEKEKKERVLEKMRTVKNLQLPRQSINCNVLREKCSHLRGIDISDYESARPTIGESGAKWAC